VDRHRRILPLVILSIIRAGVSKDTAMMLLLPIMSFMSHGNSLGIRSAMIDQKYPLMFSTTDATVLHVYAFSAAALGRIVNSFSASGEGTSSMNHFIQDRRLSIIKT